MTPTEALASALRQSGITPPPHEVNTGEVMAGILLANLPEGWAFVNSPGLLDMVETLGEALPSVLAADAAMKRAAYLIANWLWNEDGEDPDWLEDAYRTLIDVIGPLPEDYEPDE